MGCPWPTHHSDAFASIFSAFLRCASAGTASSSSHLPSAGCVSGGTAQARLASKMVLAWAERDPLDRALSNLEAVVLLQLDRHASEGFVGGKSTIARCKGREQTPRCCEGTEGGCGSRRRANRRPVARRVESCDERRAEFYGHGYARRSCRESKRAFPILSWPASGCFATNPDRASNN